MKIQPFILCCPAKPVAPNDQLIEAFTRSLMTIQTSLQAADFALLLAPEFFLSEFNKDRGKHAPARDGFPEKIDALCKEYSRKVKNLVIIPGTRLVEAPMNTVFNRAALWSLGAEMGTAYKKFAPKNELATLPRMVNGADWPPGDEAFLGRNVEELRTNALQNAQTYVGQLDIFTLFSARVGVEICNDIGFMKGILEGANVPRAKWPDVFVMPSGGMTLGNAYLTNQKQYVSIRAEPLKGWFGAGPTIKPGADNMLGDMAVRPGGLVLQCDGPASICGVLDSTATSFTMHKPASVVNFGKESSSSAYAQQPLALHVFNAITLG